MKFSPKTLAILRNFAAINNSMVFKPGSTIKTITQTKTIMAKANVDTEIEALFAIYDLPQFLGAISLFDDPELVQEGNSIIIKQGSEKLSYTCSEPSLILAAPDKDLDIAKTNPEVGFTLKNDTLLRVQKALGIIGSPEIAVVGDGEKIYLTAFNSKNPSDSSYKVEVGETGAEFNMIFLAENIKLLPGDYEVSISSKGISQFIGEDVTYWITVEQSSTYTA